MYNNDSYQPVGDLWDTIKSIAGKVSGVAQAVADTAPYARDVASGTAAVAVVPRGQTSTVISSPGAPIAVAVPHSGLPSWVLPLGIGAAALLLLRRK